MAREKRTVSPDVPLMTTSLWDFGSQNYRGGAGRGRQGDPDYVGATPSYVIWNLLQRYTKAKDLVVDPMAGSGTTLDVARDLGRRALGYDVEPTREDIFRVDARELPLEDEKADFVFVDPPYSTHVEYSGRPECIGTLDAREGPEYYQAMEQVIAEIDRVLKPDRHLGLYICDSARKGRPLEPLGFEVFAMLRRHFTPVDIVAVVRHNRTLKRGRWHEAAAEGNFFLRGFNYLFIMYKEPRAKRRRAAGKKKAGRQPTDARAQGRKGAARGKGSASKSKKRGGRAPGPPKKKSPRRGRD